MAPEHKIKPLSYTSLNADPLKDPYINDVIEKLMGLKNRDFPLKPKFDDIEKYLSIDERHSLELCKLLYCLKYRKEVFLTLGLIVESKLNSVINLYTNNRWKIPHGFTTEEKQTEEFKEFKEKRALDKKANDIERFNLFNNPKTSDLIKSKIKSFRFLRDYGGHAGINEFLSKIILSDTDEEIEVAFRLIKNISSATDYLLKNPPPKLP